MEFGEVRKRWRARWSAGFLSASAHSAEAAERADTAEERAEEAPKDAECQRGVLPLGLAAAVRPAPEELPEPAGPCGDAQRRRGIWTERARPSPARLRAEIEYARARSGGAGKGGGKRQRPVEGGAAHRGGGGGGAPPRPAASLRIGSETGHRHEGPPSLAERSVAVPCCFFQSSGRMKQAETT